MNDLHVVAVDDNPTALAAIKHHTNKIAWLHCEYFTLPTEALAYVEEKQVDAVLIDIQMQEISGLEFINIIRCQKDRVLPKFVISSAFSKYAVDGFNLEITDYLLKPYGFDRFFLAMNKVRMALTSEQASSQKDFIFLRQYDKHIKIDPSRVTYIESHGHYVKLFYKDDLPVLVSNTIQAMETLLKQQGFVRVHKKYIINTLYTQEIYGTHVVLEGLAEQIPIGRKYKENLHHLTKKPIH